MRLCGLWELPAQHAANIHSSLIYSLPWYRGAPGWKGTALGGWKFSEISTIRSGYSLTPSLSISTPGLATRPDEVGKIGGPRSLNEWFNTAALAAPPFGFYGNAVPGIIQGPGMINFDVTVYKDFRIKERHTIEFRSEFFN